MITAQQAREKTESNRKNIVEVLSVVENCANAGMACACFSKEEVNITDEMTDHLKDLGYTMIISGTHFKIEW